jgi:PAS domain S-box-containing protein
MKWAQPWQAAVGQAPVIVFVLDREGRFLVSEGKGLDALGVRPGQLIGQSAHDFYQHDPTLLAQVTRALAGEDVSSVAEVPPDSGMIWQTHLSPRRDVHGGLDGAVGVVYNISDRMRSAERLVSLEQQLHTVISNAPVILFRLDRRGIVTLSEGHGLASLGLKPGQTVGMSAFDMYPEYTDNIARVLGGESFTTTVKLGAVWVRTHFSSVRDATGALDGAIGVSVDVTGEVEMRAASERAVQLRDEFLSIASHELRTPLASLTLAVQSLLRLGADEANLSRTPPQIVARVLKTADRQLRRLSGLLDALLDVARIEAGRLTINRTPTRIDEVAYEVAELLGEQAASTGCALTVHAQEATGNWDRGRIEQVVYNLVGNALKYGAGKPVTVEVSTAANEARVVVKDQGIGIEPDRIAGIFERFERAVSSRHFGGLGLGLYIVREVVVAHGGTVTVDSRVGQGSTFTVTLPREASR